MSTITLTLPADVADRLAAEADERGLPVERLLEQLATDFVTRQAVFAAPDVFRRAAEETFRENAELFRRLAK